MNKIRIWSIRENKYNDHLRDIWISFNFKGIGYYSDIGFLADDIKENYIIEEFVGFCDITGKEIYEGDYLFEYIEEIPDEETRILEFQKNNGLADYYEVIWYETNGCWACFVWSKDGGEGCEMLCAIVKKLTIIGNIHETVL